MIGVPRASPPASTDRRHLQALTHLQKDSQPKAFELQHLGSALGWEHAIIAGARSVLAAREELPTKVVHEQLELAFEALELTTPTNCSVCATLACRVTTSWLTRRCAQSWWRKLGIASAVLCTAPA